MASEHDLIVELEAEIERLRDAAERCRKIDLVTRAAIGLGIACLASALLWCKPVALVLGLALLLGGVALHGSNRSTLQEIVTRIRTTETRRAAAIDELKLGAASDAA